MLQSQLSPLQLLSCSILKWLSDFLVRRSTYRQILSIPATLFNMTSATSGTLSSNTDLHHILRCPPRGHHRHVYDLHPALSVRHHHLYDLSRLYRRELHPRWELQERGKLHTMRKLEWHS